MNLRQILSNAIQFTGRHNPRRRKVRSGVCAEVLEDRQMLTTFTVTNNNDAGPGSLREAMSQANGPLHPGHDRIEFDTSLRGETIQITSSLPAITESLTIKGPDSLFSLIDNRVTIDGQGIDGVRPFEISDRAAEVVLKNLVLTGGYVVTNGVSDNDGGAVLNHGPDTKLDHVLVSGNTAKAGGGIFNASTAEMTIVDSEVSRNFAATWGGAIQNNGRLTVIESKFDANLAESAGAIDTNDHLWIRRSTFSNNVATHAIGAIHNSEYLNVLSSLFLDNQADTTAGAISNSGSSTFTFVTQSTFYGNTTRTDFGALHNYRHLQIINSTITNNSGGVSVNDNATDMLVESSVIADNSNATGPTDLLDEPLTDVYSSWIGETDGDPLLGPLRDNGGPTRTRLPRPDSPLIDAGDFTHVVTVSAVDARGEPRLIDGDRDGFPETDIGAVEAWPLAEIHGQKFHDQNGNGVKDAGEPGLDGWTIQLFPDVGEPTEPIAEQETMSMDLDGDGTIDPETESGLYWFDGLDPGNWIVDEVLQPGWAQTTNPGTILLQHDIHDGANIGNIEALQILESRHQYVIPVPRETELEIPVSYTTSDLNPNTTGLAVRVHFDSSILNLDRFAATFAFDNSQLHDDVDDFDADPSTDSFFLVLWHDQDSEFPGGILRDNLFSLYFNVDTGVTAPDSTMIRFTDADTDVRYGFQADPIRIDFVPASLDIDGNGEVRPLSDGVTIMRYLAGFTGDALVENSVEPGATRTDPTEVKEYLDALTSILDVDNNGVADALTDGLLILRNFAGFAHDPLTQDAVGSTALRADPEEIASYLNQFDVPAMVGSSGSGTATAMTSRVESTQKNTVESLETDEFFENTFPQTTNRYTDDWPWWLSHPGDRSQEDGIDRFFELKQSDSDSWQ